MKLPYIYSLTIKKKKPLIMSTGPNFDLSEQGAHGINRKW